MAVLQVAPAKFVDFSTALFKNQKEYFDLSVVDEKRNETYSRLADLAGSVGVESSKILSLLKVSNKPGEDGSLNTGNGVTNDIKFIVKVWRSQSYQTRTKLTNAQANRLTGVHVTPTVLFNVSRRLCS